MLLLVRIGNSFSKLDLLNHFVFDLPPERRIKENFTHRSRAMSISNEFSLPDGTRALKIILEGTGSKGSLVSRIEVLEDRDEKQEKAYAEYRTHTRETLKSLENELDNRMKTFQIEMSDDLKDLRKKNAEIENERHREMKRYMQAIIGMLFVALGTVLWKFISK